MAIRTELDLRRSAWSLGIKTGFARVTRSFSLMNQQSQLYVLVAREQRATRQHDDTDH